MLTTKELKEWRAKIVQTKDKAERYSDNYDHDMVEYYEHLFEVAKIQLALIDRLISQSEGNDISKDDCEKIRRCNCQECAFDSDEELCKRSREELCQK